MFLSCWITSTAHGIVFGTHSSDPCSVGDLSLPAQDKLAGQLIKPFWQQLQAARSSGSSIQQVLLQPLQVRQNLCCPATAWLSSCGSTPLHLADTAHRPNLLYQKSQCACEACSSSRCMFVCWQHLPDSGARHLLFCCRSLHTQWTSSHSSWQRSHSSC